MTDSPLRSVEERKPLSYHFPKAGKYGQGVCGTHGMMGTLDNPNYPVTCERCKRNAKYLAAVAIAGRYAGKKP